jgi:hypothetical protein
MSRSSKILDSSNVNIINEDIDNTDTDAELINNSSTKRNKKAKESNSNNLIKRQKTDSPFEYSLINSNNINSNDIQHQIQLGNQL